jgi:hypothetical protein
MGSQQAVFDAEGMARVRRDYSLFKEVVFGFKEGRPEGWPKYGNIS